MFSPSSLPLHILTNSSLRKYAINFQIPNVTYDAHLNRGESDGMPSTHILRLLPSRVTIQLTLPSSAFLDDTDLTTLMPTHILVIGDNLHPVHGYLLSQLSPSFAIVFSQPNLPKALIIQDITIGVSCRILSISLPLVALPPSLSAINSTSLEILVEYMHTHRFNQLFKSLITTTALTPNNSEESNRLGWWGGEPAKLEQGPITFLGPSFQSFTQARATDRSSLLPQAPPNSPNMIFYQLDLPALEDDDDIPFQLDDEALPVSRRHLRCQSTPAIFSLSPDSSTASSPSISNSSRSSLTPSKNWLLTRGELLQLASHMQQVIDAANHIHLEPKDGFWGVAHVAQMVIADRLHLL